MLAVEEELREGALGIEEGVLVADSAHKLLPRRLVHLAILEQAHEVAARRQALYGRVVEQRQVRELYLPPVLPAEEVVVAEEEVNPRTEVLWRIRRPAQEEVLDPEPLVR